jgi:hypothetical protein
VFTIQEGKIVDLFDRRRDCDRRERRQTAEREGGQLREGRMKMKMNASNVVTYLKGTLTNRTDSSREKNRFE